MTDVKDLSKIDFSKCELPDHTVRSFCDEIHIVAASGVVAANRRIDRGWIIAHRRHSESLLALANHCATVDSFITTELARIAADEEAENSLNTTNPIRSSAAFGSCACTPSVPLHVEPEKPEPDWAPIVHTEVERLQRAGAKVQFRISNERSIWSYRCPDDYGDVSREFLYQVDRNTVPAGVSIEPEKPADEREQGDIVSRYTKCASKIWSMFERDPLPLDCGVHFMVERLEELVNRGLIAPAKTREEPEKPSPKWRDCSREFAMSHPRTSSYRVRVDDGHQWSWSGWTPMSRHDGGTNPNGEEFQTTEPEEKPQWRPCSKEFALAHAGTSQVSCSSPTLGFMWREVRESDGRGSCEYCRFKTTSPEPKPEPIRHTPDAFMRRLIDCAGTPIFAKGSNGEWWESGKWFMFDSRKGFLSGDSASSCADNSEYMRPFFAQEWFEVEQ